MSYEARKVAHIFRNEKEIRKGNRIIIVHNNGSEEEVDSIKNVNIKFYGKNSLIKIYENYNIRKADLLIGENTYLEFGAFLSVRFSLTIDARAENTTFRCGSFANFSNCQVFAGDEPNLEVIIGDNFLTAINIVLRNSDGHTIYDIRNKKPINIPKFGIHIGNNVWTGYDTMILKDANIPDNVVIAAGAIVGKNIFESNSIIGGVPAKTIRTNVSWDKRNIDTYIKEY